jgi:hypothetical protein
LVSHGSLRDGELRDEAPSATEYASAAAADFAVDELVHVALAARLGMTLGSATP